MIKERLGYSLVIHLSSEITIKSKTFAYDRICYKGIDCSKFYLTGKSTQVYLYETKIIAN
jgi:hypothetical protein